MTTSKCRSKLLSTRYISFKLFQSTLLEKQVTFYMALPLFGNILGYIPLATTLGRNFPTGCTTGLVAPNCLEYGPDVDNLKKKGLLRIILRLMIRLVNYQKTKCRPIKALTDTPLSKSQAWTCQIYP